MYWTTEVTYGNTPNNPPWTPIRHKSTTLALTKETVTSEELRSDRMVTDVRHGNYKIGGDIPVEFSFDSFDTLLESALCGAWAEETPSSGTDRLKAGTTRKSGSIMRVFGDLDAGNTHQVFRGCEVNSLTMSIKPNAMVEATFGIIGQDLAGAASAPSGSTYATATSTSPFDSFTGTITEGGSSIALVTEIALDLKNGLDSRYVVGDAQSLRPSIGRSMLTGTVTAFFDNTTLFNKFVNETESSLVFTLVDLDGNTYEFNIPRIKYTGGQPDVGGEGPISIAMPFQALYSSADGTSFYIDKVAA
jgi:hypothetical protein